MSALFWIPTVLFTIWSAATAAVLVPSFATAVAVGFLVWLAAGFVAVGLYNVVKWAYVRHYVRATA